MPTMAHILRQQRTLITMDLAESLRIVNVPLEQNKRTGFPGWCLRTSRHYHRVTVVTPKAVTLVAISIGATELSMLYQHGLERKRDLRPLLSIEELALGKRALAVKTLCSVTTRQAWAEDHLTMSHMISTSSLTRSQIVQQAFATRRHQPARSV